MKHRKTSHNLHTQYYMTHHNTKNKKLQYKRLTLFLPFCIYDPQRTYFFRFVKYSLLQFTYFFLFHFPMSMYFIFCYIFFLFQIWWFSKLHTQQRESFSRETEENKGFFSNEKTFMHFIRVQKKKIDFWELY